MWDMTDDWYIKRKKELKSERFLTKKLWNFKFFEGLTSDETKTSEGCAIFFLFRNMTTVREKRQ